MSRKNDEGKFFPVGFMISGLAGFGVLCSQMPDFGWEREVGCFPSCPWSSLFWISGCIHGRTRVLYWECKSHCFLTPAARWLLWAMFDSSLVVLVKRWPLSAVSVREHSTARCPVRDQLLPREGCGRGKQGILRVLLNEEKCTFSHFSSSCFSGSAITAFENSILLTSGQILWPWGLSCHLQCMRPIWGSLGGRSRFHPLSQCLSNTILRRNVQYQRWVCDVFRRKWRCILS